MSSYELSLELAPALRVRRWLALAALFAAGFFAVVTASALAISATASHPIEGPPFLVGTVEDATRIFSSNFLVMVLYAMVGVALIVVRRAESEHASDAARRSVGAVKVLLGAIVIASAARQAYVLGRMLGEYSSFLHVGALQMGVALVPHAAIELTAMFLPLAAVLVERGEGEVAMRRALAYAVAAAIPLLVLAATTEVLVSPHVMHAVTCTTPSSLGPAGIPCAAER